MTDIIYNGITLKDVLTKTVSNEPVYDPTDVDPLYLRITVTCETIITIGAGDLGISLGSSASIADAMPALIARLNEPRKRFTMRIGGRTMLDIGPVAVPPGEVKQNTRQVDIKNGPRPTFEVTQVISNTSMRVSFSVVCMVPSCCSGCTIDAGTGIVNLKWWQSDDYDENFYVTRVTEGRLIVYSPLVNVHALRNHCLPQLQGGFKRVSMNFSEDPSGLVLDFRITDRQDYAAPPYPATKWNGVFTISQVGIGEVKGYAECRVSLEGPADVLRAALINLGTKIVFRRLTIDNRAKFGGGPLLVENIAIAERLEKNVVDITARVQLISANGQTLIQNIPGSEIGSQIGKHLPRNISDAGYHPNLFQIPHSTVGLRGLFVDALQTACNTNQYRLPAAPAQPPNDPPGGQQGQTTITTTVSTAIPTSQDNYSQSHREAIYLRAVMVSHLYTIQGPIRLPIGKNASSGDSKDETVKVELNKGHCIRKIGIEFTRAGKPPEVPDPKEEFEDTAQGITHTLIDYRFSVDASGTGSDGRTTIHKVRMELVYALSKKPDLKKGVPYGALPYRGVSQGVDKIQHLFRSDLIK